MMGRFLLQRIVQALIATLGVVTFIFFVQRLTGDPVRLLAPMSARPEDIEALRVSLGLDRPVIAQYVDFITGLLRLDLGTSLTQRVPVMDLILARMPYTLWLAGAALVIAVGIGVPLGIWSATRQGTWGSRIAMAIVLAAQSLPTFWSGILFIMFFAVMLRWVPSSGAQQWTSVILPALSLGILSMATFARVARTAVLDELGKDYIRTIKAKGVPNRRLIARHLLRNSAIPVITVMALEIANLLAGAAIVETVFAWPGLGQLTIQAINSRDFPIVQGVVFLGAVTAIALNFLADMLYGVVDPRIRIGASA